LSIKIFYIQNKKIFFLNILHTCDVIKNLTQGALAII